MKLTVETIEAAEDAIALLESDVDSMANHEADAERAERYAVGIKALHELIRRHRRNESTRNNSIWSKT